MSTFGRYLWKEWRDHRAVVLGIAICVPLLLLIARFALPLNVVESEVFVHVAAWGTLAIAILALGSDLVPGEARRGRISFLARMPSDLGVAYSAKLFFLLSAIIVSTSYGFFSGALVAGWPDDGMEFLGGPVLLVLYAAPWIFAVSCWLPRGALALPATGLALALFVLPFYLAHLWFPTFSPTTGDIVFWGAALGVGAFVVAWVSFTRGYRYGRGFLSAGWRGLAVTLLVFTPAYAYGGYRLHEWRTIDPASDDFRIVRFLRGPSGETYFVNSRMNLRAGAQRPYHALVVNAEDASWRVEGTVDMAFEPTEWIGWAEGTPIVHIDDVSTVTRDEKNPEWAKMWRTYYDTATGRRIKSGWSNGAGPAVLGALAANVPGYRRGWRRQSMQGMGHYVYERSSGRARLEDPYRRKIYPALPGMRVLIREGRWLIRKYGRDKRWSFYDPDTQEREETDLTGVKGVLPDGRVVSKGESRWIVSTPESGEHEVLALPSRHSISLIRGRWFRVWSDDGLVVARLDLETLQFVAARGMTNGFVPHMIDGDSVIGIEDERRIVRVFAGSDKREVIFPR